MPLGLITPTADMTEKMQSTEKFMDQEAADLSQLLAFADSLDSLGAMSFPDFELDDKSPRVDVGGLEPSVDWSLPRRICTPCHNHFAEVMAEVRTPYDSSHCQPGDSPESPTLKIRTSLFGGGDKPIDIQVCGEGLDPRGVCVLDHPGRHAQFKHWVSHGLLSDDTRRATLKEESNRASCWQTASSPETADKSLGLMQAGGKNVLGILLSGKSSLATSPEDGFSSTKNGNTNPTIDIVEALRKSLSGANTPEPNSSPSGGAWRDKCFIMGRNVMVAMADGGLNESNFRSWCLFFNDQLCSWGLSDRTVTTVTTPRGPTFADIDFSRNNLSDNCVFELVHLLHAFVKKLKVKTLRLSSNHLTDAALNYLKNLPYLHQLYFDNNTVSSEGVREYILAVHRNKLDYYEGLVAQDAPDESVLQTMFVSVESNCVSKQMELLETLKRELSGYVCDADSTGCDPANLCRVYGSKCVVHLAGLGCQKPSIHISPS